MYEKPFWQSKVFILAVLQAVAGIFVAINTNYAGLGWAMVGKSVVDGLLRMVTVAPLGGFGKGGKCCEVKK